MWSSLTVTKKRIFWALTLVWNQWAISHFFLYWYEIWLSLITFGLKSFQYAFTTTWIWSVIFRKKNIIRDISWSCSLFKCWYLYQKNMIVLYGNGRTSALKWCKVTYVSDKNERFYRPKHINFSYKKCVLVCKIFHYHPMHMLLTQFWHFHKVQSRFSGTLGDTGIWIKNSFSMCLVWWIFRKMTLHIQVVVLACWNDFYPNVIRDYQMLYQYEKMRYC